MTVGGGETRALCECMYVTDEERTLGEERREIVVGQDRITSHLGTGHKT